MSHTPGPWKIHTGTTRLVTDDLGHIVATVEPSPFETDDAHLIAAAPDLLAACQALQSYLRNFVNPETDEIARAVFGVTSQAIAKAEGREP